VVLFVDDRPKLLEGRQRLLEEDGYTVLSARKGREVKFFISNPVDLVLLDYYGTAMWSRGARPRYADRAHFTTPFRPWMNCREAEVRMSKRQAAPGHWR